MQKNQIALLATIVVLIIAGLYLTYLPKSANGPENQENATTTEATPTETSTISEGTIGVTGTGGYTVKEIPVQKTRPKAPDFSVPLIFSVSGFTADQKSVLETRAATLRTQLTKDPNNFTAWLALGTTYKTAGDYAQAAKMWTYITLAWPTDAIAFGNLGDLYMNFIKDYPKAEASYLGAIRNNPRQINSYRDLFTLYSRLYSPRPSAAEDILKQGIQKNPEALDLYVLLARYYSDANRVAEAKTAYNAAIVIAKGQTNAGAEAILADIEAERAALQ